MAAPDREPLDRGPKDAQDIETALIRARDLEAACDFVGAARAALDGDDPTLAARLAALAQRDDVFAQAEEALAERGKAALDRAGGDLIARGYGMSAGRLFERAESFVEAGEAFERGGDAARAAIAFERGGRPADGARAIERALKNEVSNDGLRRLLAELLLRHGRTEPAVKVLQQMADGAERDAGLPLLARSLRAMGLVEAAAEVDQEIKDRRLLPAASLPSSRPPPRDDPPNDRVVLFGRFEVIREVKKTPHAHLFEADDRVLSRRVAVKILAASTRGAGRDAFLRFEREARALEQLRHPTILTLIDFVMDGPAMVLEWMNGGSLADLLEREVFAPARAVEIACAVLTALGEAHRLGILHRDVKPSNVLFDDIGTPKLSDFGAAHLGDLSTTVTAGAIGTFSYMAPEQRRGRPASVQSDLYAAGALLYEMLTGEGAEPVRGEGGFLSRPPSAYHRDLTEAHDAVLASFLQDAADLRPDDAFEARKRLERVRWPARVLPRPSSAKRASVRPPPTAEARLAPPRDTADERDAGRIFFDTITERHVIVCSLDDARAARLRPWAKVMHPALAAVLRASVADGQIWLEAPRGRSVADSGRALSPSILGEIRQALTELHRAGGAHGCLDREHVYLTSDGVFIACARDLARVATPTDDLRALEQLARPR